MIKSTDAEVRGLIEALASASPARREAAIARLNIIGRRAVARLVAAFDTADRDTRIAMLRVLSNSADARALPVARRALDGSGDLGVAAVGALAELLERGTGTTHAEALDALLGACSNGGLDRRVRAAAAHALTSTRDDIREAFGGSLSALGSETDVLWEEALEGRLPEDPQSLREAVEDKAERAALPVLRRLVESIGARERATASTRQAEWCELRGTLHHVLARRRSRIALYDLRETFGGATRPLPGSYLSALAEIGDESCLEPLASAFARALEQDHRWRQQLLDAFNSIVRRERLTRRHSAVRRAVAKSPAFAHR